MTKMLLASSLFASAIAYADEPAPPADPATPAAPAAPADPATPEVPATPAAPAAEPTPTAMPPVAPAAAPTTTMTMPSSPSSSSSSDELGVHAEAPARGQPGIVLELSGTSSYTANPYVEYRGWTLETGTNKGARVEANLIGIVVAYELSSMANTDVCGPSGCTTGSFGSTTMSSLELGYRFRLHPIGPVRPFVTASLGGVAASSGNWTMETSKTVYGASGRAGFGIEVPLTPKIFASATIAYRILVTENPLHDQATETADKALVGGDIPASNYVSDLHLISGYLGLGVVL